MEDIDVRLRAAARNGNEFLLKELCRKPGCNALSKDVHGQTALMWAAFHGHEACVRLLLPVSDVLDKDKAGWTASSWAKEEEHESLVKFLEAYELSQTERTTIGGAVSPSTPRKRAAPRV